MLTVDDIFDKCPLRAREVQHAYSTHVLRSMEKAHQAGRGQAMVEAGTGVGKTLGYLVAAAAHSINTGQRVIVSTYSKALQRQILQKDAITAVTAAKKATVSSQHPEGITLTVGRLIGRNNFFDIDRVKHFASQVPGSADESLIHQWEQLLAWCKNSDSGEIEDYLAEFDSLPCPRELICLDSTSSEEASERFRTMTEEARTADILVTNHALLVLAARYGMHLLHESDTRGIATIILDEADQLPHVARSLANESFSIVGFFRTLAAWDMLPHSAKDGYFERIAEIVKDLGGQALDIEQDEKKKVDEILWSSIQEDKATRMGCTAAHLLNEVKGIQKAIKQSMVDEKSTAIGQDLLRMIMVLSNIVDAIIGIDEEVGAVLGKEYNNHKERWYSMPALRFSPSVRYPSLMSVSLYPSRLLKKLWQYLNQNDDQAGEEPEQRVKASALILTSATLSGLRNTEDPFLSLKIEFGIYDGKNDDAQNPCKDMHRTFEPRRFGRIDQVVYADPAVPKPFSGFDEDTDQAELSDEWLDYIAMMIRTATQHGQKTLALVTSYRVTEAIARRLQQKSMEAALICKRQDQTLDDCLKEVACHGHVALISPAGWEGLDAHSYDFAWDNVVICQLPLARQDGVYQKAMIRELMTTRTRPDGKVRDGLSENKAKGVVLGNVMLNALRRARQGIGRGIRTENDHFKLWIGDPRTPLHPYLAESDMMLPAPANRAIGVFSDLLPERFKKLTSLAVLRNSGALQQLED